MITSVNLPEDARGRAKQGKAESKEVYVVASVPFRSQEAGAVSVRGRLLLLGVLLCASRI